MRVEKIFKGSNFFLFSAIMDPIENSDDADYLQQQQQQQQQQPQQQQQQQQQLQQQQ